MDYNDHECGRNKSKSLPLKKCSPSSCRPCTKEVHLSWDTSWGEDGQALLEGWKKSKPAYCPLLSQNCGQRWQVPSETGFFHGVKPIFYYVLKQLAVLRIFFLQLKAYQHLNSLDQSPFPLNVFSILHFSRPLLKSTQKDGWEKSHQGLKSVTFRIE